MDAIEALRAIEAIKTLKARYWRGVDTKDAALLRSVFADDCMFDLAGSTGDSTDKRPPVGDPDRFVRTTLGSLTGVVTVHHGHQPEITLTSATTATGIWAMEDLLWVEDENSPLPFRRLHGWGHYHDSYRRDDGLWRVTSMKMVRIRVESI